MEVQGPAIGTLISQGKDDQSETLPSECNDLALGHLQAHDDATGFLGIINFVFTLYVLSREPSPLSSPLLLLAYYSASPLLPRE